MFKGNNIVLFLSSNLIMLKQEKHVSFTRRELKPLRNSTTFERTCVLHIHYTYKILDFQELLHTKKQLFIKE